MAILAAFDRSCERKRWNAENGGQTRVIRYFAPPERRGALFAIQLREQMIQQHGNMLLLRATHFHLHSLIC